jgi:hypothetical protein
MVMRSLRKVKRYYQHAQHNLLIKYAGESRQNSMTMRTTTMRMTTMKIMRTTKPMRIDIPIAHTTAGLLARRNTSS